jgi:hypothetical protein
MKKWLLFMGLLIMNLAVISQTPATNTGILYISTNADIFSAGSDFTNTSTLLTNNGQLYIKGNLTNNQIPATIGTGTLHLNGASAQIVAGTASFKTFNLNTNNTSGGITINTNLSISGTHTFTSGLITTAASRYIVYEDDATHSSASNTAHVNGWVKKIGNDNFIFPVGNVSHLREIAIRDISTSSEFNAAYSGATPNTSNMQSPLNSINLTEHWTLDKVAGTGTIAVTLNWDNAKVPFPNYVLNDLRVAQYISSNWTSTGANNITGTVSTNGTITSEPFSFSAAIPLSIGSISLFVPLYFLDVSAQRKENYTVVQWKTAQEQNVKTHEVERSSTGNNFTTIGQISARNSVNTQFYKYNDSTELSGTLFYRIKSVDLDGKIKYSKVVSVSVNNTKEEINLLTNPVKDAFNLSINNTVNTVYHYNLASMGGSIVQKGNIEFNGRGNVSISLYSRISPGSYILVINNGKKLFSWKVIIR